MELVAQCRPVRYAARFNICKLGVHVAFINIKCVNWSGFVNNTFHSVGEDHLNPGDQQVSTVEELSYPTSPRTMALLDFVFWLHKSREHNYFLPCSVACWRHCSLCVCVRSCPTERMSIGSPSTTRRGYGCPSFTARSYARMRTRLVSSSRRKSLWPVNRSWSWLIFVQTTPPPPPSHIKKMDQFLRFVLEIAEEGMHVCLM